MKVYAIFHKRSFELVKWGERGDGTEGYCLFRGNAIGFKLREKAERVIASFDRPHEYTIYERTARI